MNVDPVIYDPCNEAKQGVSQCSSITLTEDYNGTGKWVGNQFLIQVETLTFIVTVAVSIQECVKTLFRPKSGSSGKSLIA